VANEATRNTLADPEGNLSELLGALTQMLAGMRLDYLVSSLPPEKQSEIKATPPGVMAAHLMEDAIAGWTAERLTTTASQAGVPVVGDEVLHALLRGLKATRVAERLLPKARRFCAASAPTPGSVRPHPAGGDVVHHAGKGEGSSTRAPGAVHGAGLDRLLHYIQEA